MVAATLVAPRVESAGLDLQRLHAPHDGGRFAGLSDARSVAPGRVELKLAASYAIRPLELGTLDGGDAVPVVRGLLGVDVAAAVGATRWLEIWAVAPVVQWASVGPEIWSELGLGDPRTFSTGDLRFGVGLVALDPRVAVVGLQAVPMVTAPTGNPDLLSGLDTASLGGKLVLSGFHGRLYWSLEAGGMWVPGPAPVVGGTVGGSSFDLAGGVGIDALPERLRVAVEAIGRHAIDPNAFGRLPDARPFDLHHSAWELLASMQLVSDEGFGLFIAGGIGLTPAVGTPDGRVLVGLSASPMAPD
jgi:hypothetical protein